MKKAWYRTPIIAVVLIFTAINIYPTIGWLSLSDEERTERLARWKDEDSVYQEPALFRDTANAVRRWAQFDRTKVVNLGLDLQGGIHMVMGFDLTQEQIDKGMTEEYVQELVLQRVRRRVNDFEAKDPIIQTMGANQIEIQLPGERDIDRAKDLIMKMAVLKFHIVSGHDETVKAVSTISADPKFKKRFTPFIQGPTRRGGPFRIPIENIEHVKEIIAEVAETPDLLPEDKMLALSQPPNPWDDQEYYLYLIGEKELMTGEGLTMAVARPDTQRPGKYQIIFEFSGAAAYEFGEMTGANIGNVMAIVLDGVVCSAATIQDKITRVGNITGAFSGPQANDIAIALNSGSMPVPVYEAYTGVVGALLGADSISQGLRASIGGFLLVVIFMIVYYRVGGLIANVALFLTGLIMLAAFAYFNLTLTLPGIAGFVLTLGMAVDANVLIFERVREELANRKSLRASIEVGYQRATVTILDANVTTLIAALVLLQFGTGPIQGFGTALAIGICTSVFTALVVTKAIFTFLLDHEVLAKFTMMSIVKPDTKIPFIEHRRKAFVVSLVVIAAGFTVFFGKGYKNNLGVDFAGGTSMAVKLDTEADIDIAEVRRDLASAGFENAVVQEYGQGGAMGKNQFKVRTSEIGERPTGTETTVTSIEQRVKATLANLCGDDEGKVRLEMVEKVGPAIGAQLRNDAFKAFMSSLLFMVAYMWFRFNLVFALTAIVALFHDSLIAIGILSMWGGTVDMSVVAAILTIIGYSVNDTVVVFDRIREDMRLYTGRGLTLGQIMNRAINQILGRSLLTSLTTLLTVTMLLVFGGQVLKNFAFCLIVGIFIGTYSSIFVATALAYTWQTWRRQRELHGGPTKGKDKGGKKTGGNSKDKNAKKATA